MAHLIRAVLALALWLPTPLWPQPLDRVSEIQLKAAYLFKFGGFVDWPAQAFADPAAPFVVGVAGADDVAQELESIVAGRSIKGRPVSVRRVNRGDMLAGVHLLFIGHRDADRAESLLASARPHPILVVTEAPAGVPKGSAINFVPVDNRLRFDIAPQSAEQAALRISARLLAVARKVLPG